MDQDKFEQHLMDYLFDELDEVTAAAMRRKLDADADCRDLEAGLRATLEVAELPIEQPSAGLEERILAAAHLAELGEPWHRKLLRSLSWAGSMAMRPQLAMAALLVLVLGSSMLLLRQRPGAVPVSAVKDTSVATAGSDAREQAPTPAASPSALAQRSAAKNRGDDTSESGKGASGKGASGTEASRAAAATASSVQLAAGKARETYERAIKNYQSGNYTEARRDFALVSASGGANAASAALYEARTVRSQSGCATAVKMYAKVRQRYGMQGVGADATYEEADCQQQLGNKARWRSLLVALSKNAQYRSRAVSELNDQGAVGGSGKGVAAQRRASKTAKRPAAANRPVAKKPAPASRPQKTKQSKSKAVPTQSGL